MFGSASQGGEQADQLYFGMLGSLIAFLWSAAKYLRALTEFAKEFTVIFEIDPEYLRHTEESAK